MLVALSRAIWGWRYGVIIIGAITFIVFVAYYLIFTSYESPKFPISQGRDQNAIDMFHKIVYFRNKAPLPKLCLEDCRLINMDTETYQPPGNIHFQSC